ncbi:MAG TPA: hypothetical protein VFC73_06320 [Syntrophomonadaceae bacterium]|nr:hypothetical protein [Syntrophomonadaceae bacterium]
MKIYHVCEFCDLVFKTTEVEGAEGAVELKGVCEGCASELEGNNPSNIISNNIWYN